MVISIVSLTSLGFGNDVDHEDHILYVAEYFMDRFGVVVMSQDVC